jgi:hypothetical protein
MALIKCTECGKDISNKAKTCPNCGAPLGKVKKKGNCLTKVLGVFIFFVGLIFAIGALSNMVSSESSEKEWISMEEFSEIETGMTYDEVVEIVGCEGELSSEVSVVDITSEMYVWYGADGISNANVTFSNGKVMAKAQFGLE